MANMFRNIFPKKIQSFNSVIWKHELKPNGSRRILKWIEFLTNKTQILKTAHLAIDTDFSVIDAGNHVLLALTFNLIIIRH